MLRYIMYALILVICTACGDWNPPEPPDTPRPGQNTPPNLELQGAHTIQLLYGAEYQDAGATAYDEQDGDLTEKIVVRGLPIDTTSAGEYEVEYSVRDSEGAQTSAARSIVVADNNSPTITLLGPSSISLELGERFVDPGAEASDVEDGNLTSEITSDSDVNTDVPGDYKVIYRLADSAGATASAERQISVAGEKSKYSHIPITIEKDGFTTLQPQSDSRLIYVSSSSGDDLNDGLSVDSPVSTINKGKQLLRDGYPDWLLLKIGDKWQEGLGKWVKSGRSANEPMVISSYGEGMRRPLLMTGSRHALRASGGGGSPEQVDNLVFSGLHLYSETRDPDANSFTDDKGRGGIVWLRGSTFLLIEDNYIEHYTYGISIMDIDELNVSGVSIRKNVIVDQFSTDSHSQGIYLQETEGVKIEENTFDHNGWHGTYAGAEATKFNHSLYIQGDNVNVQIKNNIISRSSSHGMQLRPGGLIEGNFLIRNPISILLGFSRVGEDDGKIINNIILNGNDIGDSRRGWGIDFKPDTTALVKANIVAHVMSDNGNRFSIKDSYNATYSNNIVYKWEEGTSDPKTFLDPERTIEEYTKLMGGEATYDSFIENIRGQSRLNWNPDYSVESIKAFFREGFESN